MGLPPILSRVMITDEINKIARTRSTQERSSGRRQGIILWQSKMDEVVIAFDLQKLLATVQMGPSPKGGLMQLAGTANRYMYIILRISVVFETLLYITQPRLPPSLLSVMIVHRASA